MGHLYSQVKSFKANTVGELEEAINMRADRGDIEIAGISHSSAQLSVEDHVSNTYFTAIVTYKQRKL